MSGFVDDIRSQGSALRKLALHADEIVDSVSDLELTSFDRIVLSGMGGSHYAAYPAWLGLVERGFPVWHVDASELLHDAANLVNSRTLLWLTSQSGESIEIVELLRTLPDKNRPTVVGLTNSPTSTLAAAADRVIELRAGAEHAVSTRTYVNTLAAFALALAVPDHARVASEIERAASTIDAWSRSLGSSVTNARELLPEAGSVVVVARGASLAAARAGALTIKEAAKTHAEALSAAAFRHGPIELAGSAVTIIVLAGEGAATTLNGKLAEDLVSHGASVRWIGDDAPAGTSRLPSPSFESPFGRMVSEIVALQVCSVGLAELRGVEPGVFNVASKVTRVQ